MTFDAAGAGTSRVTGRAGCNRFSGGWQQNAAKVTFGPIIATRMACAPALMEFEGKFLTTLEAVTIVSFDATGAALLKATDGRAIKLRREKT
jgi:heat shock protein HslJ